MDERRRARGRPPVGARVSVRLTPELLARIDARAAVSGESRAAAVRHLLDEALGSARHGVDVDGVDRAQIRRMLVLTPRERIRHMADVANRMVRMRGRARARTA